jgi:hypothetical protein
MGCGLHEVRIADLRQRPGDLHGLSLPTRAHDQDHGLDVGTPVEATIIGAVEPEALKKRSIHPSSPRPFTTTTCAALTFMASVGDGEKT